MTHDRHERPSRATSRARLAWLAQYSPVLIAILIMLPRLLSAQFELFDDGRSLEYAGKISRGVWYTGPDSFEGRFRPVHWLWFTLSYLVGGKNPFWFYLANTLALVVIVAGLILLVRALGSGRLQASFAGLAFALAGPVIESFYTLKGEVIQLALIVLSLLSLLPYARARTRGQKAGLLALVTAVLMLAYLAKETTLVLLPVSAVWYLLARFWRGFEDRPAGRAARGLYLVANLICAPIFFLLRALAAPAGVNQGSYSGGYTFQPAQFAISALRWAGWLVRDFTWLVPLLLVAILLLVLRRKLTSSVLLLDSLVWMGAWLCVYLPWNFMAEYYMLPFALGLAVLGAGLAVETIALVRQGGWQRWLSPVCLGSGILLLAGNLLSNLTNARVQLAVDSADTAMLDYLIHEAEPGSTILVNIQDPNEYFYEMQMQLGQTWGRPDLTLEPFDPGLALPAGTTIAYIVSPYVVNQPLLTVRMGIIEDTQNMWNDGLQEFLQADPGWQVVAEPESSFRLSDVNYPRLFCPLVKTRAFCATPAPFIDTRQFTYGWQIYRLVGP
jgi:hypothetical protein